MRRTHQIASAQCNSSLEPLHNIPLSNGSIEAGGMDNSDDDFLDDGIDFDDIPADTLQQLELSAWQASQLPPHENRGANTGFQQNGRGLNSSSRFQGSPQRQQSNLYGDIEVVDLDADILEDTGPIANVVNSNPRTYPAATLGQALGERQYAAVQRHQQQQAPPIADPAPEQELKTRIEEFSRQHDRINEQLVSAREDATRKAGEVAILRANLAKQAQDFERTIASLKSQLADLTARNKVIQQAAIDDRQKLETENLFLNEDLRDETFRANNLRAKKRTETPQTPRKQRTLPYRDGFDDDEIGVLSPTRSSGGRSKRGTPSAAGKRKRKASDAPIPMPPLQLSPGNQDSMETENSSFNLVENTTTIESDSESRYDIGDGLQMMQILNHKTPPNTESDLEVMARLAFPSDPDRKISSIVLETMSGAVSNYAVRYASCLISIWDRALVEKYYEVIPLFLSSMKFILLLDLYSIAPQLIVELAGILQATIYVNGATRFEHSAVSSKGKGESRKTSPHLLYKDADSTSALEILFLLALACRHDDTLHDILWRNIHFDILLITLNDHQPLQDIVLSLKLLSTSLRRDSFGTIQTAEPEQRQVEYHFIERVTCLLFQRIEPDEGEPDYPPLQICQMRLEAVNFLEMIAFYNFDITAEPSKNATLSHPLVLPRLFRTLYDELDRLFILSPEHSMRTALINRLMHVIYKLIRSGGDRNLNEGLSRLVGAKQKHRLVLSRLAFSEGQFLEAGITEETMEMARQLLEEEDMSPEEAEALFDAFPTGGRLSGKESSQTEQ